MQSTDDIERLTKSHGYLPDCREHEKSHSDFVRSAINWKNVAQTYCGIIIAAECFNGIQKSQWLYTWDCASGRIWNPDAVEEHRPP
jgi:hypothetical protein